MRGRIRAILLLFVLLFIMASHVAIHRIATSRPHLEFGMAPDHDINFAALSRTADTDAFGARVDAQDAADAPADPSTAGWFNLRAMWAPSPVAAARAFVVEEVVPEHGNDNDTPEVVPEVAA